MPLPFKAFNGPNVTVMRNRNATVVVEAFGQALFAPGTDLSKWKSRFSRLMTYEVRKRAPTHGDSKRVVRGYRPHPGPHLKTTISSTTQTKILKGGGRYYLATGSSSNHALYPDQGTGIYAGHNPFEVKLLPPLEYGQPSLYESYLRRGKPLIINGQPAIHFFDNGLTRAFEIMTHRAPQKRAEGVSQMKAALIAFPETLVDAVIANTTADPAFKARRAMWREWRDKSYGKKVRQASRDKAAEARKRVSERDRKRESPQRNSGKRTKIIKGRVRANEEQMAAEVAYLKSRAKQLHWVIKDLKVTKDWIYTYRLNVGGKWLDRRGEWRPR
jgi:hypothetical protein